MQRVWISLEVKGLDYQYIEVGSGSEDDYSLPVLNLEQVDPYAKPKS